MVKINQNGNVEGIIEFEIDANNNTIDILIKLFATKSAANNLFGLFLSWDTNIKILSFDFEESSICLLDREKNAISEPDINAEHMINKEIISNLM